MTSWMDDAPVIAFYETRRIKAARKDHVCTCCPDPIKAGEPYTRTAYHEDGEFGVTKQHSPMCPRVRARYELEREEAFA